MKKYYFPIALLLAGCNIAFAQTQNHDFSAVAPSGQTLYYKIVNGYAKVTYPRQNNTNYYYGYTKPTGVLNIPDSASYNGVSYAVKEIDNHAFYGCSGLTCVTIPKQITDIGNVAFTNCTSISTVNYNAIDCNIHVSVNYSYNHGSYVRAVDAGIFYGCTSLAAINIGDSVRRIPSWAFVDCENITSIIIPRNIEQIGKGVFYRCNGLNSVIFNADSCIMAGTNPIDQYGATAFEDCDSITNFHFGSNVKYLPEYLCYGVTGLTSITIPDSVHSIGSKAFAFCSNLVTIELMPETPPYLGSVVFQGGVSNRTFILHGCSYDSYYNAPSWYNYRDNLMEATIGLSYGFFSENEELGTVEIIPLRGHYVRCDSTIVIQANPTYGYHLDHWSNGNTVNPDTLHLIGDSIVTAVFSPNQYILAVHSSNNGAGNTSGANTYNYLDTAIITAIPSEHYHFSHWNDGNTENPRQVLITCDTSFTAYFSIDTHIVTLSVNDISLGMAQSSDLVFAYGAPCTVTATAYTGYVFSHWNNGVTANPYTFAVLEDTELMAIFEEEGTQGIDDDANTDNIRIISKYDRILIDGLNGQDVTIYTIDGRSIASLPRATEHAEIPVTTTGVYIVKIGDYPARKVVVIR